MAVTLFINACVRGSSRTRRLAEYLLAKLGGPVEEVDLSAVAFPVTDEAFLQKRDRLLAAQEYTDPLFDLARQFAAADAVVVAAPYCDLSFPAALKQYFEQINVVGVTFRYSPQGIPQGLCKARQLFYVTTSGGPLLGEEYGFGYVQALARGFYQIPQVRIIRAEGLDLPGADVGSLLHRAETDVDRLFTE